MLRKAVWIVVLGVMLAACSGGGSEMAANQPSEVSAGEAAIHPLDAQPTEAGDGQNDLPPVLSAQSPAAVPGLSTVIVDTGQTTCYDNNHPISCPQEGEAFFGQDANYQGTEPAYQDNGDGTVTDLNTGLMWQQTPIGDVTYAEAVAGAATLTLGGYDDWRLPSIQELYSLALFSGLDVSICAEAGTCNAVPFLDTGYFDFEYGDTSAGHRMIDAQYWSSTEYVSTTMNGNATVFGVNFADGRIKGYPTDMARFVRYVRGNPGYGVSDFVDNGDGTVTDRATGLMWLQSDSGSGMNWESALGYCESLNYAGHGDWRLPNAHELLSIVDYTRSPATTHSAAIDPIFNITPIIDEGGDTNYAFYWTSTTHASSNGMGDGAVYVAFGEALGWMQDRSGGTTLMDVHGAGAQRRDPKSGDASSYPFGHGPQGDVVRIDNYARCVRGGSYTITSGGEVAAVTASNVGDGQPVEQQPEQPQTSSGPDVAGAAVRLGVTEEALRAALGDPNQGPPDLVAAANQLGITVEALQVALGIPVGAQQPGGQPPGALLPPGP